MADDDQIETEPVSGLQPGTTLSDTYEIVRQIALGGMAEVYRARNIHTDEPVAIKVVLPEFARDQTNLALFKKEATVLGRLNHDSIVRYHTFSVEKVLKRPYLAMEFVDGVPLSEHIKRAPLDATSTRTLISRVASGLAAAHDLGVIHRDLSPDNVILPDDDVAKTKIIDFGIAKAATIGDGTLLGGKFAGKYNFVSPEQLGLAGGEVTEQSDIYSLGLIAAAAMLGKPLDMSGSQFEVLEKRRTIPDLSGIDPAMQSVIAAMLEPLPQNRPKTMREVIELLASPPPLRPAAPSAPLMDGTGTVFGAEMPFQAAPKPPVQNVWAEPPQARSLPPLPQPAQGSWPPPPANVQPQPPSFSPPPFSAPPQSLGTRGTPFGESTGFSAVPEPQAPPMHVGEPSLGTRSESPFGPGPTTAPPSFGKTQPKPKQKKSAGGLIAGLLILLVLVAGGAAYYFLGMNGGASTGESPPATAAVQPAEPQPEPAVTPPAATPAIPAAQPDTEVASLPEAPVKQLSGAAKRVAWLQNYPLGSCEYAAPTAVADNSMAIEAFGNSVAPFEKLAADFEKDNGIEPDVGVRILAQPQCAAADFLRAVQPSTDAGPTMSLKTDTLASGGALEGEITGTEGWTTDLLLVDYRGGVQNVSVYLTSNRDSATFALPPLLSKAADPVPMIILAVSSKGGLNATRLVKTHAASQIFPVILREIQAKDGGVSVSARYFKLGGAAAG